MLYKGELDAEIQNENLGESRQSFLNFLCPAVVPHDCGTQGALILVEDYEGDLDAKAGRPGQTASTWNK